MHPVPVPVEERVNHGATQQQENTRTKEQIPAGFEKALRISISQAHDGNSLIIRGAINGTPCKLTLDTGASRTVISSELAKCFPRGLSNFKTTQLLTATGQHISVRGEKSVVLKLRERTFQHKVIVADIVDDCILGLDFMREHHCEIDVNQGILKCGAEE